MALSDILSKSGLSPAQAEVYEALLTHGTQQAGSLTKKTSLKRGLVYKVLEDLIDLGLAGKEEEEGKVARFFPKHPSVLREVVENRRKSLKDAELSLDAVLPSLISNFNMVSGAPGVEIYEGEDAKERILWHSLTSKTEIYTYSDIETVMKMTPKVSLRYAKEREKLGIKKKALLLDTPFARDYVKGYFPSVTDIRLISAKEAKPFHSSMEIYDGTVSYITYAPDKTIGVILHDPYLYEVHKYVFEALWEKTEPLPLTRKPKDAETLPEERESADAPPPMETVEYDDDEYFVRL
ncbi:MAG TPA: helix-turn-helix domain-containing protein [Candidatus Fimivivens sp.]|nr:helix-turn-helix domain-containing protein [Candidatus Fimivivens sp.]